jgi:hypothetical protein
MTEQDFTVEAVKPTWKERFSDWCRNLLRSNNDNHMVEHAFEELNAAGLYDADSDYDGMMGPAVMRLVQQHAKEDHSGFSSMMAATMFVRLVNGEPLAPLTGEDSEWSEWYAGGIRQNRRCSKIFQREDGTAYTLDAVVFIDPNGARFTSSDSVRDIEFPYMPPSQPEYQHNPPKDVIPVQPEIGQTFTYKDESWCYDGEYWQPIED